MKYVKLALILLLIALAGFAVHHFFIDTLSLVELAGKQSHPASALIVNLLDFDTGITRWEVIRLKGKIRGWQKEEERISAIQNPEHRVAEQEKLMAEMLQDPTVKNIAHKVLGASGRGLQGLLNGLVEIAGS
jgi:hypothetical protein